MGRRREKAKGKSSVSIIPSRACTSRGVRKRVCQPVLCPQAVLPELRRAADVCDRSGAQAGVRVCFGTGVQCWRARVRGEGVPRTCSGLGPLTLTLRGVSMCLLHCHLLQGDKKHQAPHREPGPASGCRGTSSEGHPWGNTLPEGRERGLVCLIFCIAWLPVRVPVLPASAASRRPRTGHSAVVSPLGLGSARHTVGAPQHLAGGGPGKVLLSSLSRCRVHRSSPQGKPS